MVNTKTYVRVNRLASWTLAMISLVMITSGYIISRLQWDRNTLTNIHTNLCYLFTVVFILHFYISVFIIRYPWRRTLENIIRGNLGSWTLIKLTQRISAWIIVLGGGVLIITGLGWQGILGRTIPFAQHRAFDLLAGVSMVIHLSSGVKSALTRRQVRGQLVNFFIVILTVLLVGAILYTDAYF